MTTATVKSFSVLISYHMYYSLFVFLPPRMKINCFLCASRVRPEPSHNKLFDLHVRCVHFGVASSRSLSIANYRHLRSNIKNIFRNFNRIKTIALVRSFSMEFVSLRLLNNDWAFQPSRCPFPLLDGSMLLDNVAYIVYWLIEYS